MVVALAGVDPEALGAATSDPGPAYVGLRVVNADNPCADYGGYWSNTREVMSPIVHAVTESQTWLHAAPAGEPYAGAAESPSP
ncbi:MAG: hypothetical protein HYX53_03355 [Chloroflexi bacterium]|nr:hypothetical protein [Chloroflexota bacterium]